MSSIAAPAVDPIRRLHLDKVGDAFRSAIVRDLEHVRELLAYLRDR